MQNHERQLLDDILDSALDDLESSEECFSQSSGICPIDPDTKDRSSVVSGKLPSTKIKSKANIVNCGETNFKSDTKKCTQVDSGASKGIDKAVNKLIDNMKNSADDRNLSVDEFGENIMKEMMRDFELMSGKDDADNAIDGVMRQLLSKDLMYEPMKQVTEKFPQWLAQNKSSLSETEYLRYGKQYQYFQRILNLYDTEPENIARLLELMQDIQQLRVC